MLTINGMVEVNFYGSTSSFSVFSADSHGCVARAHPAPGQQPAGQQPPREGGFSVPHAVSFPEQPPPSPLSPRTRTRMARAWPLTIFLPPRLRLRARAAGAVSKVHLCAPVERQHRRKVRLPARAAAGASSAPTSPLLVPQTCGCSAYVPYARCEAEGPFEQGVRAGMAPVRTHAAGRAYSPNRRRAGRRVCVELTGVCVVRKT